MGWLVGRWLDGSQSRRTIDHIFNIVADLAGSRSPVCGFGRI